MPLVLMDAYQHHGYREGETVGTLTAEQNNHVRGDTPLVLMDQGGGVMTIEHDKVGTLRAQTHGHEPLVLQECYPIDTAPGVSASNLGFGKNGDPMFTLTQTSAQKGVTEVMAVYENQRAELRLSEKMNAITNPGGKAGQGNPVILENLPHCFKIRSGCEGGGKGYLGQDDKSFTLATNNDQYMMNQARVRKLTPKECERLQGFPDDYTKIPYRNKSAEDCPDSTRYKAIGNSWAVPCVRWIGQRIKKELEKIK